MNGTEFVRTIMGEIHGAMVPDIKDLTQEYLRGLLRLEADLKTDPVQGITKFVLLWGQKPQA